MDYHQLSFDLWYEIGLRQGFIGPFVCATHDGVPSTLEEDNENEAGNDPCTYVARRYFSPEEKQRVEENHSPSVWRNPLCPESL